MPLFKLLPLLLLVIIACKQNTETGEGYTAFTGATIIDGSESEPIQNGVLLVKDGRVAAIGTSAQVSIPDNAIIQNVSGKTIMPGIINAHGHVGDVKGIEGGHYSKENIIDNLKIYARYGITSVVSLGGDKQDAEMLRAVNDTISTDRARLFIAGEIINGKTSDEAIAVVDSNHRMGVDFMKIRVDDNLGTSPKMPEDIYRAVITRSHELGYKIATHMYYLDDAAKLLDAGTDMLAHSVRDRPVTDTFIALLKAKKACYCPTLTRELSTFVYSDTADFFTDPFFTKEYDSTVFKPLEDPARQLQMKNSQSARKYKEQLPVAMANLKMICNEGIPIVFGTDSGVPTRFIGYFEHLEMEMMHDAGLTPKQIIISATKNAAEQMGLNDLGTLSAGHWADFIILDDDPLTNIRNVRKISAVYIGGKGVFR